MCDRWSTVWTYRLFESEGCRFRQSQRGIYRPSRFCGISQRDSQVSLMNRTGSKKRTHSLAHFPCVAAEHKATGLTIQAMHRGPLRTKGLLHRFFEGIVTVGATFMHGKIAGFVHG